MFNFLTSFCWKLLFVACAIQLFTGSPVLAAVYYVSNSAGSDASNGTSTSSPWKTLSKVNSRTFQPGDTILFKRGDTWTRQNLKINSSGQSGRPITFAAYGTGDRPKFDGSYEPSAFFGVYVVGRSWIAFSDLYIYRFDKGMWIDNGSNNITMRNSHVSHITGECVGIKKNAHHVIIDGNTIHDCGLNQNGEGVYLGTDPAKSGGVPDRTSYVTVINNHIYNTGNEAIELKAGTTNSIVQNNIIHAVTEGYNGAIHAGVWDNPVITPNHTIDGNRVYDIRGTGGYGMVIRSGGIKVSRNIIYNSSQSGIRVRDNQATRLTAQIFNNTLYKNARLGIEILDGARVDNKNNLAWANGSGNISYNPLFVDAERSDFRLCTGAGSPGGTCSGRSRAIDAGVNVGLPFGGTAPDLGALESSLSLSPPVSPSGLVVRIQ